MPAGRARRESPEAAARRLRYAALDGLRRELGATRILTAHQRDDQVETVLLQIARGVPLEALGGIAERRGPILRPLLAVSRVELLAWLGEHGLVPLADPTNLDLRRPRNRLRLLVLPELRRREHGIDDDLLALGERSRALRARLDRHFEHRGRTPIEGSESPRSAPEIDCGWISALPPALRLPALRWMLAEVLGVAPMPSGPSMNAFLARLEHGKPARLRLPGEIRELAVDGGRVAWASPASRIPAFSYTFSIPGEVELPELGLRLRVGRSRVEPWMFRGDPRRAGFVAAPGRATVRNRRPGDRLHPIGAPGTRKLKEILIDRRVPEESRDRIPLLELAGRLAWVPGVTLDRRFAIADEAECWLAELEPLPVTENGPARASERMAH